MVLTKIREGLGIALALIAALSTGAAVISHMRNNTLQANMEVIRLNNTTLADANKSNAVQIETLITQRIIDDHLIKRLDEQFETLSKESSLVRKSFQELKSNDVEFKALLSQRHPVELSQLLNARKRTGNDSQDGENKAP